jgi:hypothetical protein
LAIVDPASGNLATSEDDGFSCKVVNLPYESCVSNLKENITFKQSDCGIILAFYNKEKEPHFIEWNIRVYWL